MELQLVYIFHHYKSLGQRDQHRLRTKKKLLDRKTEGGSGASPKIVGGPTSYRYGVRPLTTVRPPPPSPPPQSEAAPFEELEALDIIEKKKKEKKKKKHKRAR